MKTIASLLCGFLLMVSGSYAVAQSSKLPQIISMKNEFSTFAAEFDGKSADEKMVLWSRAIEQPNQAYYDEAIFKKQRGDDWQARRSKALAFLFAQLSSIEPEMFREFSTAEQNINRQVDAFFSFFPDADFSNNTIYIGLSLFQFDGQSTVFQGRPILSFGVDNIALFKHNPTAFPGLNVEYNSDAFYVHEIFHLYHSNKLNLHEDTDATMMFYAWQEGLATYVSSLFAPDASVGELLLDGNLASCEEKGSQLIKRFKQDSQKTDQDTYSKWFTKGSGDESVPRRAAYCVGYLLVKQVADEYTPLEMASMSLAEVETMLSRVLAAQ